MTAEELGLEAWVLIPNVLQAVLRQTSLPDAARERVAGLQSVLQAVQPPQMLAALAALGTPDRQLLIQAAEACLGATQTARSAQSAAALGTTPEAAAGVISFLRAGAP